MLKKINDFLSNLPMTIIGGIFLVISFIMSHFNYHFIINPAWVTIIICGIPLLYLALWRVIHNKGISKISSALLIVMAMIAAIIIGDIFAGGEVAFIMAIGAILEDATTNRAKKGLKKLLDLAPTKARILKNGKYEIVSTDKICKGDILRVLPGETIAIDGKIIKGETSINQAIITGESLPVDKEVGDEVFCGTINCFGTIDIEATNIGKDCTLQKLIEMVQNAEKNQAPMQSIADKWASYLVPIALIIAIVAGIVTNDIIRAVTVLVVFCPCALVLATPTAIMAAIGQATKHGVIIKSGEALEKMGKVDTIAFDKTGTLTYGNLQVCDVVVLDENISQNQLISLTSSAEAKSEHPLAKAIVEYSQNQNIDIVESKSFKMIAGKGVYAEFDNCKILCGNKKYIEQNNITIDNNALDILSKLSSQGKASIIVADCDKCIGIIALSDTLRQNSVDVISKLKKINITPVLLTGDNSKAANYFANKANIDNVYSELLPEDKVSSIIQIQSKNHKVCMIGDGINDAPALKTADVGVAMGKIGSSLAIESADIALVNDDISKLPYLKKLANATIKTIKFSISLSMFINFLAVTSSVLGLLNPTTGALVHNAGSCFVVLIAALLYDRKFD